MYHLCDFLRGGFSVFQYNTAEQKVGTFTASLDILFTVYMRGVYVYKVKTYFIVLRSNFNL